MVWEFLDDCRAKGRATETFRTNLAQQANRWVDWGVLSLCGVWQIFRENIYARLRAFPAKPVLGPAFRDRPVFKLAFLR